MFKLSKALLEKISFCIDDSSIHIAASYANMGCGPDGWYCAGGCKGFCQGVNTDD